MRRESLFIMILMAFLLSFKPFKPIMYDDVQGKTGGIKKSYCLFSA